MVAIDCETTGLDTRRAELVSLAAVRLKGDRVLTSQSLDLRLTRPASLTGDSIRIHGLRGIDLEGGDSIEAALAKFLDFVGNRPLVGWCLEFDLAILNRYLRAHLGFELPNARVEVSRVYAKALRRRQPEAIPNLRFEVVARALEVPVMGRHTALGDAVTTALMYTRVQRGLVG
ncbi:3'-5' exonuclease [Halomonas salifodinae]